METLSPLGPVFHAGTLAGNPMATAAGLAALGELTPDVYIELSARARRLAALLRDACAAAGFPARFPVVGTLVGIVCGDVPAAGRLRRGQTHRRGGLRRLLPGDARRGRGDGARAPTRRIFVGLGHDRRGARGDRRSAAPRAAAAARIAALVHRYPGPMRQVLSWRFVAAIVAVARPGARAST